MGVESTRTGPELTFVTHDTGGHLAINKTYELGEWVGQKRRKNLNTTLTKVCLGKLLVRNYGFQKDHYSQSIFLDNEAY